MNFTDKEIIHLCPKFQVAFQILGKKWNGLIIESFLLAGPLRFRELANKVEGCSDRVLTERLKELAREGIVEKQAGSNSGVAHYQLTTKGEELRPIMKEVHGWSDKWCDPDKA
ncbi:winged helix-turn-helix transcriptional regulator [Fructilactobacillus fructivorans]|uniref:Transcriptional regulator n=1 Tax=Fructilactobacillus fructivorans TaxID=1614 RepID=A0A0C1Q2T3_9LACO|nr:helix-turn-helix domain-containing protein [Fructilactobacillus fructivorans]KID42123.1 Transcriptional regulator, MarR family [Fructilactobacillus fructivorans]KRN13409.1 hypothetical protein IV37_GL000126 [Fructilactobacillus fructivorans]MCT0152015.1 transcriptional regulator [Fructilactobacillus fructivorans]MCT2867907.1 transcriptional regulator [Fructilactobacillus fructivorans]MCT2868511.1 transcriptional regulator [Fructilactobacillus fructivorans]